MKKMILTLFLALSASTLAAALLPLGTIYAAAYEDYEDDEEDEGPDIMYYIDDTGDEPDDEEDDTDEDDGGIYIYVDTSDVDNAATPDEEHWSGDTTTSSAASTSSVSTSSTSSTSSSHQASSTPIEEAYSARSEAIRIPAGLLKAAGIPKARITQAENELRRILKVTNFENIKLKRQSAKGGMLTIQIKYQTKVFYQEISSQAVTYHYRGKPIKLKELMPILINSYRSPKGEAFGY